MARNTLDVSSRRQWRTWLQANHESEAEIWLVFHKRNSGRESIEYEDAIQEAICFGWVDSLVKRLDEKRYGRKFTPRKLDSRWSSENRRRFADMKARGLLAAAGLARPPTERDGDAPRPDMTKIPAYIPATMKSKPQVVANFEKLSPSCKRQYVAWIDSAKKQETKDRRLAEAMRMLAAGKKLGLK